MEELFNDGDELFYEISNSQLINDGDELFYEISNVLYEIAKECGSTNIIINADGSMKISVD